MSSKLCPFGNECVRQHWDGQSFPLRVYTRVLVWDHPLVGKLHWHHLFQLWIFASCKTVEEKCLLALDEVGAAVGPSAYKGYWYARTIALAFAFFPPSYLSSNCQDNMFIRYFVPCQLETLGCYEVSNLHVLSLVALQSFFSSKATFTDFQTSTYLRCSWLHTYTSGFAKNLFTPYAMLDLELCCGNSIAESENWALLQVHPDRWLTWFSRLCLTTSSIASMDHRKAVALESMMPIHCSKISLATWASCIVTWHPLVFRCLKSYFSCLLQSRSCEGNSHLKHLYVCWRCFFGTVWMESWFVFVSIELLWGWLCGLQGGLSTSLLWLAGFLGIRLRHLLPGSQTAPLAKHGLRTWCWIHLGCFLRCLTFRWTLNHCGATARSRPRTHWWK